MPQVEFSSLYKFVASIGLVLIVASVGLPWILLQSTDVLLISEKSIASLPDSAGEAIERRQVLVAWAQDHLPLPLFIALAVAGLGMLVWALWKWAPSQQRSDASEKLALQKNQVEYKNLTHDEVDKKLKDEVAETNSTPVDEVAPAEVETEKPANLGPTSGSSDDTPASNSTSDHKQESKNSDHAAGNSDLENVENPQERSLRLIAQLRDTENQVAQLIQKAFGEAFDVEGQVEITSGTARGRVLDVLLNPKVTSRAQLGVEIKRWGSHVMQDRLSQFLVQTAITTQDLSTGKVYTGAPGRPREAKSSGILFLVLNSSTFAANVMRIDRQISKINAAMRRPIGVVMTTPERLETLQPGELRDAIASVWAEPDEIVALE